MGKCLMHMSTGFKMGVKLIKGKVGVKEKAQLAYLFHTLDRCA